MANYKKICWTEADVQCPFYISDDRSGRSITCEGYSAGAEVVSRFRTLGQKDRHMGCFCVIFTILLALIYRSKNKRS